MPDNNRVPATGGHVVPEQPPAFRIQITATGDYRHPMPQGVIDGLIEEVAAHMKAYGFSDIQVTTKGGNQ